MKKYIITIIKIVLFLILFVTIGRDWNYLLNDDSKIYSRPMMHEMYTCDDNIDVLFLGSSHSYMSLIPEVADEELGMCTFNLGTSAQCMDGTFALLKEVTKKNNADVAFLEIYYGVVGDSEFKNRSSLISTYLVSDYMRPSFNKYSYLINAGSKAHWVNGFIPGRRYWDKVFEAGYVKNLWDIKHSDDYKNYAIVEGGDINREYKGKGYVANYNVMDSNVYMSKRGYGQINVNKLDNTDWKKYLDKIVQFCKAKNIELVLYIAPEPQLSLVSKGNYDDYNSYIKNYAAKNGIDFWDFNVCSKEYFDASDISLFADEDHLNYGGAKQFTRLLSDIYSGQVPKDIFYESLGEKIKDDGNRVEGIAYSGEDKESDLWKCYVVSEDSANEEYRVTLSRSDGEEITLIDFGDDNSFELQADTQGELEVVWRKQYDISCEGTFRVSIK